MGMLNYWQQNQMAESGDNDIESEELKPEAW